MYSQGLHGKSNTKDSMYRSNSSLEQVYLDHSVTTNLRREYGSHGSIDAMHYDKPPLVHSYNNSSFARNQFHSSGNFSHEGSFKPIRNSNDGFPSLESVDGPLCKIHQVGSPKLKVKFPKFWGSNGQSNISRSAIDDNLAPTCSTSESFSTLNLNAESEDQVKRRKFAHYDCQSLGASLDVAASRRGALLARRRNTATGASAASLAARPAPGPDPLDHGDGKANELIENCPFFRNEIGGEEERCISLCPKTSQLKRSDRSNPAAIIWHRPRSAYGLSVLEFPPGQSHWKQTCPFSSRLSHNVPIESQDLGASYYKKYFFGQDHQNWFGMDDQLGPIAISIRKERVEVPAENYGANPLAASINNLVWQYRLIIRTSELLTLRGSILEDAIPTIKPSNNNKSYSTKDVIEFVAPEIQHSCLRLGISNGGAEEQLSRLDEQGVTRHYKVGVMFCRRGQATEEDMYNNQEPSRSFDEFLQTLGQTVRLQGFQHYKAGLDNKSDSTGMFSVYTVYQHCEIMFHVSTMLPYTPNNRQQLLRKRHIGNDIVTIVFQEPGAQPFTPKNIRSQFQHVFIVVQAVNPCSDNTHYRIAVSRSKDVPIFGPPIRVGALYPKGEAFTNLLLSKVINGENAAIQSPKFSTMATRTRQEYLKDLAKNYVTTTPLDTTGQKFSLFSSLLSKGGSAGIGVGEGSWGTWVRGARCAVVEGRDEAAGGAVFEALLGLSPDTLVLLEEPSRQIVFVTPTKSLLGWVEGAGGWLRIYYHRGECVVLRGEGLLQLLAACAPHAAHARHLTLQRNANGQLGFHVIPDGLVTNVATNGAAARAGLRDGCRLLEVCHAAVVTLSHDQLVDLLKTSEPVTITMAPPHPDAALTCPCALEPEIEAVGESTARAQLPGRQKKRHEMNFSPPRSSDSGYGTGSSGRSGRRSPDTHLAEVRHEEITGWPDTEASSSRRGTPKRVASAEDRRFSADDSRAWQSENGSDKRHQTEESLSVWQEGSSASPRRGTPRRIGRPASGVGSLQEELMRLIDPESIAAVREAEDAGVVTQARPAAVVSPPLAPLPLPDSQSMDWSALVDTATQAMMLQFCDEHQYPSMDNMSVESGLSAHDNAPPDSNQESWRDLPACGCGLRARVLQLETEAARGEARRRALTEELQRARRQIARYREESARAVQQLQGFRQWFAHTVERQ